MGISVLHVLHSYRAGGMENMIAQMAWRLPQHGVSVEICALTEADDFKLRLPPETTVVELAKKTGLDVGCALRLRRLIRQRRPQVVHSHNWNALIYSLAALAGVRTPLLHGEHALLYGWERYPWRLRVRQALYSRCDVVHTVSDGQARELVELGFAGRVDLRVVRNGVDIEKFSPQDKALSRAALGIPVKGPCIGMAARCVPEKRHALLLQAFELVGVVFPDVTLVLAGAGGHCEAEIRSQVARHPFAERIVWLGHRNDMALVYNSFDLLVLTSTSEGMSNVSLEAMSCGVPVLMHESCGSEELIHEGINGSTGALSSPAEVAESICRLLASPDALSRMGSNAREWVEHEHPLEKTARDYAAIYSSLVGKQQRHPEVL